MAQQKTAEIFDLQGKTTGKITLPNVFSTPLRPDVIKRAVLAIQSSRIQPQGSSLFAFYINWLFAFFFNNDRVKFISEYLPCVSHLFCAISFSTLLKNLDV